MMYDADVQRDDALGKLLSENKPVPDQAFCLTVQKVISGLSEKKGWRIRAFRVKRPLAYGLLVASVSLLLCACATFTAVNLYRRVFKSALIGTEEQAVLHQSEYPEQRQQVEALPPEEAAEMDAWLDFRATEDAAALANMRGVVENAVPIGQRSNEIILSEFSAFSLQGEDESGCANLYFGVAAPSTKRLPEELTVTINGREAKGALWDVPTQHTDDEQLHIYEVTYPQLGWLPKQALLSVFVEAESFVFQYDFEKSTALLPTTAAEKEEWLAENEQALAALKRYCEGVTIACADEPHLAHGVTATISTVALQENALRVTLGLRSDTADEMRFDIQKLSLSLHDVTYERGRSLFVTRETPDSGELHAFQTQEATWKIILPCPVEEVVAASPVTLSFVLSTQRITEEGEAGEADEAKREEMMFAITLQE